MSKRKAEEFQDVGISDSSRRFKEKHSLDSDEEDNDKEEEQLLQDDIEGQEEGTVDFDDGIKITPFNMNEEMEEGHFDKDGMYIFDKKGPEIRDEWIDSIDWQTIKQRDDKPLEQNEEDSDSEPEALDLKHIYGEMIKLLQPGESIAKALRRLGGNKGKHMSSSQRWQAKKQKKEETEEDKQAAKNKEDMLKLTGLADEVLQTGNMDIYEMTYEKLGYELKQFEEKNDRVTVPENIDDDDALDMFADDFDKKENAKDQKNTTTTAADDKKVNESSAQDSKDTNGEEPQVMWEYRWEEQEDAEVHGPYSSSQMLDWSNDGFFEKGVYCRKVGSQTQWYSSKRVDFELYT